MMRFSLFNTGDYDDLLKPLILRAARDFQEKRGNTPPIVPPQKCYGTDHLRLVYPTPAQPKQEQSR